MGTGEREYPSRELSGSGFGEIQAESRGRSAELKESFVSVVSL
jgi:hypothetical protein